MNNKSIWSISIDIVGQEVGSLSIFVYEYDNRKS